jgi:ABC-2 type transport system ATP-binding protein
LRTGMFGTGTQVRVVGDAAHWIETVRALSFVRDATAEVGTLSVSLADPDGQNPELVRALVQAGAHIRAVEPTSHSLEEVYLELVENDERGVTAVSH